RSIRIVNKYLQTLRTYYQCLAFLQLQLRETFTGNNCFDQFTVVIALKLQLRQRADRMSTTQLHHDAFRAGHIALDIKIMRAHISNTLGILGCNMLRRIQTDTFSLQHSFMYATMEQIDVAQKAIDERRGWIVVNILG